MRRRRSGRGSVQFLDRVQDDYTLNIGRGKRLKLLLDSTEDRYGGCAPHYPGSMTADQYGNVKLSVPRYSAAYYEVVDTAKSANPGQNGQSVQSGQRIQNHPASQRHRRSKKKKH